MRAALMLAELRSYLRLLLPSRQLSNQVQNGGTSQTCFGLAVTFIGRHRSYCAARQKSESSTDSGRPTITSQNWAIGKCCRKESRFTQVRSGVFAGAVSGSRVAKQLRRENLRSGADDKRYVERTATGFPAGPE